jgi:hypothetical protein
MARIVGPTERAFASSPDGARQRKKAFDNRPINEILTCFKALFTPRGSPM